MAPVIRTPGVAGRPGRGPGRMADAFRLLEQVWCRCLRDVSRGTSGAGGARAGPRGAGGWDRQGVWGPVEPGAWGGPVGCKEPAVQLSRAPGRQAFFWKGGSCSVFLTLCANWAGII